jgi:hypothetical protein
MSNPVSSVTYRPFKASLRQLAQPLLRHRSFESAASGAVPPASDCPRAWAGDIQVGS